MKPTHYISDESLQLAQLKTIVEQDTQLALSSDALSRLEKCRTFLEKKIGEGTSQQQQTTSNTPTTPAK